MRQECKSPREIALMRQAGLLVAEALRLAAAAVRPGVTTATVNAVVEEFFAQHGATPLFKGVPGKVPFPAACCISVNEEVVHGIPGPRTLKEGDLVSIDTGCRLNGWCADSAITLPVGRVSDEAERLLRVTRDVLYLAIEQIGKCRFWSEVARQMEERVKQAGFTVVENFVGHGIGRQMHEEPQVPNFVGQGLRRANGDFRLVPGLVIAVEPMVNMGTKKVKGMADHWTQVTQDGRPSAHFEHTIAVTEKGAEVLTAAADGSY